MTRSEKKKKKQNRPKHSLAQNVAPDHTLYRAVKPSTITDFEIDLITGEPVLDIVNFSRFVGESGSCIDDNTAREYGKDAKHLLLTVEVYKGKPVINKEDRFGAISFLREAIPNDKVGTVRYVEYRELKPNSLSKNYDIWKYAHCAIYPPNYPQKVEIEQILIVEAIQQYGWEFHKCL